MKNYFIECIQQYQKHGLVNENYKIISKGKAYSIKELTSKVISEGFIVYEKLSTYTESFFTTLFFESSYFIRVKVNVGIFMKVFLLVLPHR